MRYEEFKSFETDFGGKKLVLEIGKVCEFANGQVTVRYNDTVVNVTAVASKDPREGVDFFPLSVDYEEKMYAAGKIPGGFIKREGRPSERAILNSRLIDRPIRPLFPKGYYNDVQVVAMVLSVDESAPPEIAAMIGSSVALTISDIPFDGPTGSVLIGMIDGNFIINPNREEREKSDLHLVVSGTKDAIMMVEAGANEVPEDKILEAIFYGHEEIKKIISFIEQVQAEVGKPKTTPVFVLPEEELEKKVRDFATEKYRQAVLTEEKMERLLNMEKVEEETKEHFMEEYSDSMKDISAVLYSIKKEQVRKLILEDKIRPDNRKETEIRPIYAETGFVPRVHGTGLFKRGQTQVLSITTLAPIGEAQRIDGIGDEVGKRYMHHYNFPPYSVGEAKPLRSPGRREIGHGALAERALIPVLPCEEDFPYAIRVVSEVLASNGSTSMASTCGSCLSLMDAGVPISKPVSGIAMGLIKEGDNIAILSDIQGLEDFLGDMDFKVTGTKDGVTAIQMDIKIHGLSKEILERALNQAKEGRMFIMDKMLEEIQGPREEVSKYAPRIITVKIDTDDIRTVIGPGGKMIQQITSETGANIDIEQDGTIFVAGENYDVAKAGADYIKKILKTPEEGDVYDGKVVRIMPFGAFVQLVPGKDGLLHISKIADRRIEKVEDELNIGDDVKVKVESIDNDGKISLSRV